MMASGDPKPFGWIADQVWHTSNNPWLPAEPQPWYVPQTIVEPQPALPPIVVMPTQELDALKKRLDELEKAVKKLSPVKEDGPECEPGRVVEL